MIKKLKGGRTTISGILTIIGFVGAVIHDPHTLSNPVAWTTVASAFGLMLAADAHQGPGNPPEAGN